MTPMKAWGLELERMASTATVICRRKGEVSGSGKCSARMNQRTLPSVPFLKPMGKETPLASSRWSWDSVVRAPMAPQEMRSAMN